MSDLSKLDEKWTDYWNCLNIRSIPVLQGQYYSTCFISCLTLFLLCKYFLVRIKILSTSSWCGPISKPFTITLRISCTVQTIVTSMFENVWALVLHWYLWMFIHISKEHQPKLCFWCRPSILVKLEDKMIPHVAPVHLWELHQRR